MSSPQKVAQPKPPRASAPPRRWGNLVGAYGLVGLGVLLAVIFSLLLPDTFPTSATLRSILTSQSIPALLALGATIPIVTGKFDLSIGYGLGLSHVLVMMLVIRGVNWVLAALIVIVIMACVGVLNGLLVEFGKIDSFVATLGTGYILYAITGALTDGARVVPTQTLPADFTDFFDSAVAGIPMPALYVLLVMALLWVVLERLPLGRYLYVIGSNARAADLMGIPTRRYSIIAFVGSSTITAFAGALYASQQQIGNPSVGMDFLLPAFVGALLGSTAIKGRVNALGTLIAVAVLAIGIAGLNQFGAQFWVTPLFNGVALLIALGIAGYSTRKKIAAGAAANRAAALEGAAPPDKATAPPATGAKPADPAPRASGPQH
ncbi:ABC transporter permease [Micrococcales bacterium 31B]|nr:ABC transporter permease [Micrococcales bacterium 31B]